MKKLTIIILSILTLFIIGCGASHITQIEFDNFNITIKSSKIYLPQTIENGQYEGLTIYQETKEKTKNDFISSILIKSQNNINLNTKDFANKNIDNLKSNISSINVQQTKTSSFVCSGEKIIGIIKSFTITENKKDNYYLQFFFIHKNKGYILSFNSQNKKDNSSFEDSLKTITCTE